MDAATKAAAYEECLAAIRAIWKDEGGASLDEIALMSTINSVLAHRFPFFWTGFYRVCGDQIGRASCRERVYVLV